MDGSYLHLSMSRFHCYGQVADGHIQQGGAVAALAAVNEIDFDWPRRFWNGLSEQDQQNLIRYASVHAMASYGTFIDLSCVCIAATSLGTSALHPLTACASAWLRSFTTRMLLSGKRLRMALG